MRILVVDDEVRLAGLVAGALADHGHDVRTAASGTEALSALGKEAFDLVVTDLKMPPPDGMAVIAHCRSLASPPEVVVITAHGSVSTAVEAMRAGAYDYLTKPFELDAVVALASRVDDLRSVRRDRDLLRRENERLVAQLGDAGAAFAGIVGESPAMLEVFALARKVAETDATVLIRGESGTGKGRLARAIHLASPRAAGPFVKINSGALPETLLESELFGHEKGAFTGAIRQKPGRFELASGGTVFLDEIGEISPALQVKLLQILEDKTFVRVGGTEVIHCDTRLIAATHRDLETMIREGEFRQDLFYRLNVFPIEMPPLRVRGNDILLLIENYLQRRGLGPHAIGPDGKGLLLAHDYPGNVRELENLLERAIILAGGHTIGASEFPSLLGRAPRSPAEMLLSGGDIPDGGLSLEAVEKGLIERALAKAGGNKSQAARLLGVTRRTLYSRMEKHGILDGSEARAEEQDPGEVPS